MGGLGALIPFGTSPCGEIKGGPGHRIRPLFLDPKTEYNHRRFANICRGKGAAMSVSSMTGYARAEGQDAQVTWLWEAKSVNGRGLETRCRLPPGHDALEVAIREVATRKLRRGNIQLSLTVTRLAEAPAVRVNTDLLHQLLGLIAEIGPRHSNIAPARWDGLLSIKGMLDPMEAEEVDAKAVRQARETAMKGTLEDLLDQLAAMRQAEGARIEDVLRSQLREIGLLTERAGACAVLRPEAVKGRIRAQVAAVLEAAPALPEERIAQEVALLAVKSDVREELDRLRAHLATARELIEDGGAVGRKLDFLAQEFNREANTLCSKSSDVELTRAGLDLKAVIDQFREQVQNIE